MRGTERSPSFAVSSILPPSASTYVLSVERFASSRRSSLDISPCATPISSATSSWVRPVRRLSSRRLTACSLLMTSSNVFGGGTSCARAYLPLIMRSSAYAVNSIYSDLGKKDYPYTECPMTFSKDRASRPAPGTREQGPLCKRLTRLSAPRASLAKQVIGAASVEWHAKDSVARSFNKKYGFIQLVDDEDHLWLSMKTIEAMLWG
jgi:hypothetical protein